MVQPSSPTIPPKPESHKGAKGHQVLSLLGHKLRVFHTITATGTPSVRRLPQPSAFSRTGESLISRPTMREVQFPDLSQTERGLRGQRTQTG